MLVFTGQAKRKSGDQRASARRDDGLTLIELMISSVIMVILVATLATAVFVGLQLTSSPNTHGAKSAISELESAHDAQIAEAWFPGDVRSASTIAVPPLPTPACSAPANMTRATALVDFSEPSIHALVPISGWYHVSYWYGEVGGYHELVRATGGPGASCSNETFVTIAQDLSDLSSMAPTVGCNTPASTVNCSSASTITSVKLTLNEIDGSAYVIYGEPSVTVGTSVSGAGTLTNRLYITGGGSSVLSAFGGTTLMVNNGDIVIDSGATGAISVSGSASVAATGQKALIQTLLGGTCTGSCNVTPTPTSMSAMALDPFDNATYFLPQPDASSYVVNPSPVCSGVTCTYSPGLYTATVDLTSGG